MLRVGFEPTISAGERPKTYALDRAATRTGKIRAINNLKIYILDIKSKKNLVDRKIAGIP